jgi:translation initiation factor 3 subunit J
MLPPCVPLDTVAPRPRSQRTHRLPQSDWENSSDEEDKRARAPAASAAAAPPKKKGTLKAKLAEKEAQKAAQNGPGDDDIYDEDAVLDPREKERRDRERELMADLTNATDLFGAAALGGAWRRCGVMWCTDADRACRHDE